MKKAVVLFSGGLDSTTCLSLALKQGFEPFALSFNYAQRHSSELEAAKRITAKLGVAHKIFNLPIDQFGCSALTDKNIDVPKYTGTTEVPSTYVPARNTIFLSVALGFAEVLKANDIFVGVSSVDYSGYPDCRPEYIDAFQRLANLATQSGVQGNLLSIQSPLMHLSKAETIKLGLSLGVDYGMTVSCYQADSDGYACGQCDSCMLRKKGFEDAQVDDPTAYYSSESI
ncbi:MAG: 7-cyano-7-deazaguanine synthase QueC [Gammaproteobacteria bacterium]